MNFDILTLGPMFDHVQLQWPTPFRSGNKESLVGWLDLGSNIALVFSLILWKNPFEDRIFKRKKHLIIWMHFPPPSLTVISFNSLNVIVIGICFEILVLKI